MSKQLILVSILSLLSVISSFVRNWIFNDYMSPAEFGLLIYLLSIMSWVGSYITYGFNHSLISHVLIHKSKLVLDFEISSLSKGFIGRSLISFVAIFIFLFLFSHDTFIKEKSIVTILFFSTVASVLLSLLGALLIAAGRPIAYSLIQISSGNILVSFLVFVLLTFGVLSTLNVSISMLVLVVLGCLYLIFIINDKINLEIGVDRYKELNSVSRTLFFSGIMLTIWMKLEVIFIEHYLGTQYLPSYFIAFQIAFMFTFIPSSIFGIISSRLKSADVLDLNCISNSFSYLIYSINLIGFVFVYSNVELILNIYGFELESIEYYTLKILLIGFFFYSVVGSIPEVLLILFKRQADLIKIYTFSLILSLFLNLVLTLNYGVVGASLSVFVVLVFTSALRYYVANKHYNVSFDSKFVFPSIIFLIFWFVTEGLEVGIIFTNILNVLVVIFYCILNRKEIYNSLLLFRGVS